MKIATFERAKSQSIRGNYDFAKELFEECKEEGKNNIYAMIEVSIIDIIKGDISSAKENIDYCMNNSRLRTLEYLKELDTFRKRNSNVQTNSEFMLYIDGLEKLQDIIN